MTRTGEVAWFAFMNPKIASCSARSPVRTRPPACDTISRSSFRLPMLAPELRQLGPLGGREAVSSPTGIAIGLGHPVADRLGRRFKCSGEFFRSTPGPDQRDPLLAKLRGKGFLGVGIVGSCYHKGLVSTKAGQAQGGHLGQTNRKSRFIRALAQ